MSTASESPLPERDALEAKMDHETNRDRTSDFNDPRGPTEQVELEHIIGKREERPQFSYAPVALITAAIVMIAILAILQLFVFNASHQLRHERELAAEVDKVRPRLEQKKIDSDDGGPDSATAETGHLSDATVKLAKDRLREMERAEDEAAADVERDRLSGQLERRYFLAQPNFDCSSSVGDAELAICTNQELAQLDGDFADLYGELAEQIGEADRLRLRAERARWLAMRNECASNKECIRAQYEKGLAILSGWH
jgi:hypothetical protein